MQQAGDLDRGKGRGRGRGRPRAAGMRRVVVGQQHAAGNVRSILTY